jgi:hypothetical protein
MTIAKLKNKNLITLVSWIKITHKILKLNNLIRISNHNKEVKNNLLTKIFM